MESSIACEEINNQIWTWQNGIRATAILSWSFFGMSSIDELVFGKAEKEVRRGELVHRKTCDVEVTKQARVEVTKRSSGTELTRQWRCCIVRCEMAQWTYGRRRIDFTTDPR